MDKNEIDRMFDAEQKRINDYYALRESSGDNTPMPDSPTDYYQKGRSARFYDAKNNTFPRGSSQKILVDVSAVLERLAPAYRRAKSDSDLYRERGDKARSEMVKQQYYEDDFLPALEALVGMSSVDEVLNSKQALSTMDKYATLDNTAGTGFAASYIKSAHKDDRGSFSGRSDAYVDDQIKRIAKLLDANQVRSAISIANKLIKQIDGGQHLATEDDYAILAKVSARG